MKWLFDQLGMHAPLFLSLYVAYQVFYNKKWFYFLLALLAINYVVNVALKIWIKEPRPNPGTYHGNPRQYYGMPSGHAQIYASVMTWYWLYRKRHDLTEWGPIVALFFITTGERWVNNKHTYLQLIVGTGVGVLLAWALFLSVFR